MRSKDKPTEPRDATPGDNPTGTNVDDVLRPFHEASNRFVQSHFAAHESAFRQHAHAWLDFQERVRQVEQDAYRGIVDATRKYLDQFGAQTEETRDRTFATRAQAQTEYENEVRRIQTDAHARLTDVTRKWAEECGKGEAVQQLFRQRQDAYQKYMSDLQQAWSTRTTHDPQTMNAIAAHILSTIQAVSQTG